MNDHKLIPLTAPGQIKPGDVVFCEYKGVPQRFRAKEVLNPGTDLEEILINVKRNTYFITTMAIDGTSWAKNVRGRA
ncbi:MAG: hypothetical protein CMI13_07765 [Oleibacter sp.]|nr:hypothetical protein [Thalassolituus sp.]